MSDSELVWRQKKCVHGEMRAHPVWDKDDLVLDPSSSCPGGVEVVLPDDKVLIGPIIVSDLLAVLGKEVER